MEIIDPKQTLKDLSKEYSYDQRGYYYFSSYANTLKFLMEKWQEMNEEKIYGLYFIELDLDDFIKDDLENVYVASGKTKKNYSEKCKEAERRLNSISSKFLNLFDKSREKEN